MKKRIGEIETFLSFDPCQRGIGVVATSRPIGDLYGASASLAAGSCRRVGIITGFVIESVSAPETDGPLGALVLGRVLQRLGKEVTLLTDRGNAAVMRALDGFRGGCRLEIVDGDLSAAETDALAARFDHLVAIERLGRTAEGLYCNMRGEPMSTCANLDGLVLSPAFRGQSTGIGDGGNEIGMGRARDLVLRHVPQADRIATIVATDFLLCCGISNWGGHALARAVHLLADPTASDAGLKPLEQAGFMTREAEKRALECILDAGAVDGPLRKKNLSVDSVEFDAYYDHIEKILRA